MKYAFIILIALVVGVAWFYMSPTVQVPVSEPDVANATSTDNVNTNDNTKNAARTGLITGRALSTPNGESPKYFKDIELFIIPSETFYNAVRPKLLGGASAVAHVINENQLPVIPLRTVTSADGTYGLLAHVGLRPLFF